MTASLALLPLVEGQQTSQSDQTTTALFNTSNSAFLYMKDGFAMSAAAPGEMDNYGVIVALPATESTIPHTKRFSQFVPTELGEWYTQGVQEAMTIEGVVEFVLYVVSPINENAFWFNFTFTRNQIPITASEGYVNSLRANEPVRVQAFGGVPAPLTLDVGDVLSLRINVTITSKSGANIYFGSKDYPSGIKIEKTNSLAVTAVYGGDGILGMRFKERFGIQAGTMFFRAKLDGLDITGVPTINSNTDRSIEVRWTLLRIPDQGDHNAEIFMGYSATNNVSLPAVAVTFPVVVTPIDLGEWPCYIGLFAFLIVIVYTVLHFNKKRKRRIIEDYRKKYGYAPSPANAPAVRMRRFGRR